MTVHNSSNGKIGQSPRVPAFARETKMKNMRRGHVSAILVREGVQRMCFSQKSDLFFRFEKLGVRRKSPVSPAAFSTPFHAGGPHRDAARAPAQAHSRSSRPGAVIGGLSLPESSPQAAVFPPPLRGLDIERFAGPTIPRMRLRGGARCVAVRPSGVKGNGERGR